MTPAELARLHRVCFTTPAAWSERDFQQFMCDPTCRIEWAEHEGALAGFILLRQIGDEAEILTLAVAPHARRQGIAQRLLQRGLAERAGARHCFLEVAASNHAAQALYAAAGFQKVGLRPNYYRHPDGQCEDALILRAELR